MEDTLSAILLDSPVIAFRAFYSDGWPITYISDNINAFGYNANDLIDNKAALKELIYSDNWPKIENKLARDLQAAVLFSDSVRLTDALGDNHIIEMHLKIVKNQDDSGTFIQGTFHKIEMGQGSYPFPVDEKNVDLYDRLASLVMLLPVPAMAVSGHHYHANPALFRYIGYHRQDISTINDWFYTLNPKNGQEMENQYYKDRFQTVSTWQVTLKNGQTRWVTFNIYPVSSMELWIWTDTTDIRQVRVKTRFDQQQNLLLKLVDALPLMITVYDKANHLTFVNKTFASELGYDNDYVQKHNTVNQLFPSQDYREEISKQFHSNIREWRDVTIRTRSGKMIQSSWNNFAISKDMRIGVGINNSMMQELQNSLLFYRKQMQLIASQLEDVVFTIDTDKKYTSISGTWLNRTGLSEKDFVGKTALEFFGTVDARIQDHHHEKALHGIPSTYEFRASGGNDNYWLQTSISPLRDHKGVIIGAIGICRDITSFKKANERLNLQDYALQVSANAIVITDEEGKIFWANEALSTLTGYEVSEVLGKHTRMFKSGEQTETFYKNLWEAITHGKVWKGELINRKKDGSLYVEEQTITPFTGSNGKPFYIAVKQDVTSRVEREKNLHAAYKEKQTLLEEVHHRVKNNLALVSSLLELQMATASTDRDAEILRRSQQRIHSMALIHEKLYQQDNMSDILIDKYIERLLKDTEKAFLLPGQNIKLRLKCDPISLNINQAVPFALICNEMVTNAYTHAFENKKTGSIEITITSKNGQVELVVNDDGIGIASEKSDETPTSLGLTIMQQLTRQLNGKLIIESNHGTKASLSFKPENVRGSYNYNL
ncbi:MAG TPA: PAS domain S-box protein [Balneolales bacterium]|nr:PAS domain S-box protein [Balneolales bacterium]